MRSLGGKPGRERIIESLSYAFLPALAALHAYLVLRDRREYGKFMQMEETTDRQRYFKSWVRDSVAWYGLLPLLILLSLGHVSMLRDFPEFIQPISDDLRVAISSDEGVVGGFLGAIAGAIVPLLLFGHTGATLFRVWAESRENNVAMHPAVEARNIAQLFPRNSTERRWTAALSVSAGITEELCFRLVIPLLVFLASGSAWLALGVATVWFGLVHAYQGWVGIFATMFLGAVFCFVYVHTQSLWLVMLIHAVLDLNDLAIGPWFAERLRRRQAEER